MTQQPWGGPPDQWNRGQSPLNAPFGQAPGWPQQAQAPYGQQPLWGQQPVQQAWPGVPTPSQFPPPRPPRRRRSFFGSVVRFVVVCVFIMVAFSFIRGALSSILPTPTGPTPTSQGGSTAGGTNGSGTGTTQYQNEGYQAPPADFNPPDLPQPKTYSEAETWLTDNAVYRQNVPSPTNCTMKPVESGLSKAQMQTRLNELMACLMQVWEPPLKASGFEMPRPPVTVYTSSVTTACGVMKEINAAYCAGDQRVYYALQLLDALPNNVASTKYAAEDVIAHEFGHAVQARTGILISERALEQKASDANATIMSRRTEMQADCFGGLYVESVAQSQGLTQADLQTLVDMTYYLGDDVLSGQPNIQGDHGLGKNRMTWFAKGVQTNQVGVCNTWVVPATQVR